MKRIILVLLLLAAAVVPAPAAALLAPADVDASRLLPPPAPGSALARSELTELHAIHGRATLAMNAAASRDSADEKPDLFDGVLGFDVMALPATAKVLSEVQEEEEEATKPAKAYFHRDRPWIVDASIATCDPDKPGPATNSYPSGHSTTGWSIGIVLAALMPEKAQTILARADEFAENRLVCGVHFRSDIEAGRQYGTEIALKLMALPSFKADMDAARAELRAAHRTN